MRKKRQVLARLEPIDSLYGWGCSTVIPNGFDVEEVPVSRRIGFLDPWIHKIGANKSALNGYQRLTSQKDLPEHDSRIDEHETSSDESSAKLPLAVGCGLIVFSFVLLFKVLSKFYFDAAFSVSMGVTGFFLSLGIFLLGGLMVFHWLGLAPFEFLGHRL